MERKFEKKFAYPISTVCVLLTRPSCEWEIFWRMIFREIIISEILRERNYRFLSARPLENK